MSSPRAHRRDRAREFAWMLVVPWLAFGLGTWYVRSFTRRILEGQSDYTLLGMVVLVAGLLWIGTYLAHRGWMALREN